MKEVRIPLEPLVVSEKLKNCSVTVLDIIF